MAKSVKGAASNAQRGGRDVTGKGNTPYYSGRATSRQAALARSIARYAPRSAGGGGGG
jgi:hypothetical protein